MKYFLILLVGQFCVLVVASPLLTTRTTLLLTMCLGLLGISQFLVQRFKVSKSR